jgi:hypothetical protein
MYIIYYCLKETTNSDLDKLALGIANHSFCIYPRSYVTEARAQGRDGIHLDICRGRRAREPSIGRRFIPYNGGHGIYKQKVIYNHSAKVFVIPISE